MHTHLAAAAVLLFIASGCGDGVESCEAYNAAHEACYETFGMEAEFLVDCADAPKEAIERYDCLADLYSNAQCMDVDTMPTEEEADACG